MGRSFHLILLLSVTVMLASGIPGVSLGAAFVKFDGISGESQDKDHDSWSDIVSWGAPLQKPGPGATATRGSGGEDRLVNEMTVTKIADRSSALLQSGMTTGKEFATVTVHVVEAGGSTKYYVLKGVTITSIIPGIDAKTGARTERITLQAKELAQR